jgi:energy-coupling factor transporter ATP-binding protein EcfA2
MYYKRTLETAVRTASRQLPVVLVTGPRQAGKTTLLRHLCEAGRRYVTLDDLVLRALAQDDPALFLERFPPPPVRLRRIGALGHSLRRTGSTPGPTCGGSGTHPTRMGDAALPFDRLTVSSEVEGHLDLLEQPERKQVIQQPALQLRGQARLAATYGDVGGRRA